MTSNAAAVSRITRDKVGGLVIADAGNPNRVHNGSLFARIVDRVRHPSVNMIFYLIVVTSIYFAVQQLLLIWHATGDSHTLILGLAASAAWFFWIGVALMRALALLIRLYHYVHCKYWPPNKALASGQSLTIIQPLSGIEQGTLETSLCTVLHAVRCCPYKHVEVIYSIETDTDPALTLVRRLQRDYKDVDIRIVMAGPPRGGNAKLNNTYTAYEQAKYDWLLFIDSNVRLDPDHLIYLSPHMNDATSPLSSTIIVARFPRSFWGHVFMGYMNSFFANGFIWSVYLMSSKAWWGKCGVLRKSAIETAGGLERFANCFNEDSALGWVMQEYGYPVQFVGKHPSEYVGDVSFGSMWSRFVRWGIIRRCTSPVAFLFEPVTSPLLWACIGAYCYPASNAFWWGLLYMFLGDWCSCGDIKYALNPMYLVHWMCKECIYYPAWVAIWLTHTIEWRGQVFTINSRCMLERVDKHVPSSSSSHRRHQS